MAFTRLPHGSLHFAWSRFAHFLFFRRWLKATYSSVKCQTMKRSIAKLSPLDSPPALSQNEHSESLDHGL